MSVLRFQALLDGFRYCAPRWTQVFDPEHGTYNAVSGDAHEGCSRLLLAESGYRTWATPTQIEAKGLTAVGDAVETFSVRLQSQKQNQRFVVPYRNRVLLPTPSARTQRRPRTPFPAGDCERALAEYGVVDAMRPGYEEYALRALLGYVADTGIGAGCKHHEFVEEVAATFLLGVFGFAYNGVRESVLVDAANTLTPLELAHDLVSVNATTSVVLHKLNVKR